MGDEEYKDIGLMSLAVFADGKKVGMTTEVLDLSGKAELTCDEGKESSWNNDDIQLDFTITSDTPSKVLLEMFRPERRTYTREERKALLFAVTHGCEVVFSTDMTAIVEGVGEANLAVGITTPSVLKSWLRTAYNGEYAIYDKHHVELKIKKGKLRYDTGTIYKSRRNCKTVKRP